MCSEHLFIIILGSDNTYNASFLPQGFGSNFSLMVGVLVYDRNGCHGEAQSAVFVYPFR